ncbi:MAG: DUF6476 family protein [Pseudomonadota bacterium]
MTDSPKSAVDDLSAEDARNLRFLRRLVTTLTATMILGVLTIVVLLVMRLNAPAPVPAVAPASAPALALPPSLTLPEGEEALAVTQTPDALLVVTRSQLLLVYDASGTELRATVPIEARPAD